MKFSSNENYLNKDLKIIPRESQECRIFVHCVKMSCCDWWNKELNGQQQKVQAGPLGKEEVGGVIQAHDRDVRRHRGSRLDDV